MNRPGDWNCRTCQYHNFQRRDSCQRCGEPRHVSERGGGVVIDFGFGGGRSSSFFSTGPDVRPGDWYCNIGNCGAHNFAIRSSCFKCGAFKEEAGGAGGFSSGGGGGFDGGDIRRGGGRSGWKSGDWICIRQGCNEHNFASRMECFRCNAPREAYGSRSAY